MYVVTGERIREGDEGSNIKSGLSVQLHIFLLYNERKNDEYIVSIEMRFMNFVRSKGRER